MCKSDNLHAADVEWYALSLIIGQEHDESDSLFLGLMYFCIQDKLAIRSLIDGLRIPLLETRVGPLDRALRGRFAHFLGAGSHP